MDYIYWLVHPDGQEFRIGLELKNYQEVDCGIGSYEYWGAHGVDTDWRIEDHEFAVDWLFTDARVLQFYSPFQIIEHALEDEKFMEQVDESIWDGILEADVP